MPLTQSQPWSQVDEESGAPEQSQGAADSASRAAVEAPGHARKRTFVIQSTWSLIPLAAAAGWTLWGAIHPAAARTAGQSVQTWMSLVFLVAAMVIIVIAARRARANRDELSESSGSSGRTTGQLAQLLPAIDDVERQAARVRSQAAEIEEHQQQMAVQIGLAEAQRRSTEAIIDAIDDPILSVDSFGRVAFVNQSAGEFMQVQKAEALRKPIAEVIQQAPLIQEIQQSLESIGRGGVRRLDLDKDDQTYSASIWPLVDPRKDAAKDDSQQSPHGVVAMLHNVTLERQASKMKSEFVAHVAHELRTPLSSIRGYVELLVDGEVSDEATRKETYGIIQTSTERLGRMIDNMLNISRIESGTVRIHMEPVSLAMVVKEAADMVRPQAQDKGLTLNEELMPVVFRVHADRDMLMEAVQNLLSNAVKYTPAGGTVTVRMMPLEAERNIAVEVSDSGVGIPEADLPHMFEKFFRVEANKKVAKGTGLGLNLVKHIVESVHKGRITLTSEVGKGSTFRILLPLMQGTADGA